MFVLLSYFQGHSQGNLSLTNLDLYSFIMISLYSMYKYYTLNKYTCSIHRLICFQKSRHDTQFERVFFPSSLILILNLPTTPICATAPIRSTYSNVQYECITCSRSLSVIIPSSLYPWHESFSFSCIVSFTVCNLLRVFNIPHTRNR